MTIALFVLIEFLLAAHADLDCQGDGFGKYSVYERHTTSFTAADSRLIDCHEPNTNFKLLGFFKEPVFAGGWNSSSSAKA